MSWTRPPRWLLLLVLAGCDRGELPLLELREVAPKVVEAGARIDIKGEGFPTGRDARVSFDGMVYRGGGPPVRTSRTTVAGRVVNAETVRVDVTDALVAELSGEALGGRHATFVGTVQVAFASVVAGGGVVAGERSDQELDVFPRHGSKAEESAWRNKASSWLASVGLAADVAEDGQGGAVVRDVVPGSAADRAGIVVGERLVAAGHVHVVSLADLIPADDAETNELLIRTADASQPARRVVVAPAADAVRWRRATRTAAFTALVATLLVAAAVRSRTKREMGALLRGIAAALREARRRRQEDAPSRRAASAQPIARLAPVAALLGGVALSFSPWLRDVLDAPVVLFGFCAAAWALSSDRSARAQSSAERGLLALVWCGVFLANTANYLVSVGAVRLKDVVSTQEGGWPTDWAAFHAPQCFLFAAVTLVTLAASLRGAQRADATGQKRSALATSSVFAWSVVFSITCLGGASVPSGAGLPFRMDVLLGTVVLALKSEMVASIVRRVSPAIARVAAPGRVAVASFIAAITALAVSLAGTTPLGAPVARAGVLFVGLGCVWGALLFARSLVARGGEGEGAPRLNPFL